MLLFILLSLGFVLNALLAASHVHPETLIATFHKNCDKYVNIMIIC